MKKKGKFFIAVIAGVFSVSSPGLADELRSHFACKDLGSGTYKPYWLQALPDGSGYRDWSETRRGLLGQNRMSSWDECNRAVEAANHEYGIVCSRTGLNGWKPTIYTGTTPGRADYGYMGGSSMTNFDDCLLATAHSSQAGVCFWGGSSWYVSPINRAGISMGPFRTLQQCVSQTAER